MAEKISDEKFNRIYLILWGICIFVALMFFVFYKFGFRLTNQFVPVKVSAIELTSNETDLRIFIDNREQKVALNDGTYLIQNVIPGAHSILVSKDNFWPWTKTVSVAVNDTRKLYAFIFPMNGVVANPVKSGASDYSFAEKGLRNSRMSEARAEIPDLLPDESLVGWLGKNVPDYKISADKSTALYTRDGTIYVAWISSTEPPPRYFCEVNPCKLVMPVMVSVESIKSVDFYKGLRNMILFSAGKTIYGIEVDREGTQNFQPFSKGDDPYFFETSEGALYIKDGNSISRVDL